MTSTKYPGLNRPVSILLSLCIGVAIFSCCSTNKTQTEKKRHHKSNRTVTNRFVVSSPEGNKIIPIGGGVRFGVTSQKSIKFDSLKVLFNTTLVETRFDENSGEYYCSNISSKAGHIVLKINIFHSDSLVETHSLRYLQVSPDAPEPLSYKVLRKFHHDPLAYTQGLIFHKGFLIESTGQPKRSSIRRVDPKTGKVIKQKNLDSHLFGEGVAQVNNQLFMLTYRARVGFVFDDENFELIRKFNLQTAEGWGITNYQDTLLMSDGSSRLYTFLPDEYFTLIGEQEICDNLGFVDLLNELEYTAHGVFANIYGKSKIVLIDLKSGTISHTLDLKALIPEEVPNNMDYVLNGIAYNPKTDTYYITGKQWPVMYEIAILFN